MFSSQFSRKLSIENNRKRIQSKIYIYIKIEGERELIDNEKS